MRGLANSRRGIIEQHSLLKVDSKEQKILCFFKPLIILKKKSGYEVRPWPDRVGPGEALGPPPDPSRLRRLPKPWPQEEQDGQESKPLTIAVVIRAIKAAAERFQVREICRTLFLNFRNTFWNTCSFGYVWEYWRSS